MKDLQNKIALVTGGAQGIGKGNVKHFLELGMNVTFIDIDEEAGNETSADLKALGSVEFVHGDTSNEVDVVKAVEICIATLGGLHVLVNNAGIAEADNGPIENLSLEEWNRKLAVNVTGYFLTAKHSIPYLRKQGGAIVNIASVWASYSDANGEAYSASKGAILSLTHALANSLGPTIRVNSISPGWIDVSLWKKKSQQVDPDIREIDRNQHPVGRLGTPDDIAQITAFLASESSGFITGQNFIVDGGMITKMHYEE